MTCASRLDTSEIDPLATIPLFATLDATDRRAVMRHAAVVEAAPGEAITREGSAGADFFVLLDGEAVVSVAADEGADPADVGIVRPGDTVGELAALLAAPRTATVIATRPSRLLRLDATALEAVFASSPRFAVALSRELAHRLKDALAIKNDLQLERVPDTVVLDAPDLTRMRQYMVTYYAAALKHVLKQHRLLVDRRFPAYETSFTMTADEHAHWLQLFATEERTTPFTYHTTVGTMALMRVVGDLGVNFKNLMHLKSEMGIAPGQVIEPGRRYRLIAQVEDILALRDDRVAVVCASHVHDESGARVRNYRDYFVILNLEPEYVESLRGAKGYGHLDAMEFHGLATRRAQLTDASHVRRQVIAVPEDMGMRYGKVSGDLNLVHTTALAAKIFGHPRPFIQGLCTANYVLRHVTAAFGPPAGLRITFAKRVFVGQSIVLRHTEREFEICDGAGALLAFGDFDAAAPRRIH